MAAQVVLHVLFTFNVAVFTAALLWYLARRCFPEDLSARQAFLLAGAGVLAVRVAYVALFVLAFPDRVLSPDSVRYLFEIRQIAEAPWEWNPITGSGPYYQVTPKMGMSYLYGVVLFLHQIDSLYAVLVLNIVFALLTALAVFLLTRRLTPSPAPALIAMLLTSVYPETLFWTSRVARENLTLFLVPILAYASLRLYETFRLRYLVYAVTIVGSMLLVRAQLVMFAVLIVVYFGVLALTGRHRARALVATAVVVVLMVAAFSAFAAQIRRAAGVEALRLLSFDVAWWVDQSGTILQNVAAVLSPVARGSYGAVGLLMIPFALVLTILLVLTLVRFRHIFAANVTAAGLLLFLSLAFLFALAVVGRINIRFRATVAPLLLSLISVSVHYYWTRCGLPRLRA